MKRLLFPALILITSLLSCKKTETVEKIVEKTIEVPANPLKIVAAQIVTNGGQTSIDYYTPAKTSLKKFVLEQGASSYGFYIYYGDKNFDTNFDQTAGRKIMYVLCVNKDWTVNAAYNLDYNGTGDPTRINAVIKSTDNRPNLVPTNVNFYNNLLCGFMTIEDVKAL